MGWVAPNSADLERNNPRGGYQGGLHGDVLPSRASLSKAGVGRSGSNSWVLNPDLFTDHEPADPAVWEAWLDIVKGFGLNPPELQIRHVARDEGVLKGLSGVRVQCPPSH